MNVSSSTAFYVPSFMDKDWYLVSLRTTVVEGRDDPANPARVIILQPADFAEKWPSVPKAFLTKCAGPARDLTIPQHVKLLHKLIPQRPLPKWYGVRFTGVFKESVCHTA